MKLIRTRLQNEPADPRLKAAILSTLFLSEHTLIATRLVNRAHKRLYRLARRRGYDTSEVEGIIESYLDENQ